MIPECQFLDLGQTLMPPDTKPIEKALPEATKIAADPVKKSKAVNIRDNYQ